MYHNILNLEKGTIFIELKDTLLHITEQKLDGQKAYFKVKSHNAKRL